MAQALPRLRAQVIPGGYAAPPEQEPDAIGDLLSNLGVGGGEPATPVPAPEQKAPTPRLPEEVPY
jgi:hypothetical protein